MKARVIKNVKFEEFKWNFKQKFNRTVTWVYQNKELVMFAVPILVGVCRFAVKRVSKMHDIKMETELKDLYIYDMSFKHYWKLKRKLTPNEWLNIERRKENGEPLGKILDSMKVLK